MRGGDFDDEVIQPGKFTIFWYQILIQSQQQQQPSNDDDKY